ncbi:Villin-2 [Hordeum vulgare]|nr:Villin-2 [Hordeum vulgare]
MPWNSPCLLKPPALTGAAGWACPDCGDEGASPSSAPAPAPTAAPGGAGGGSGLLAAIREIEADATLFEQDKARRRQELVKKFSSVFCMKLPERPVTMSTAQSPHPLPCSSPCVQLELLCAMRAGEVVLFSANFGAGFCVMGFRESELMTYSQISGPLLYSGAVASISSPSKRALWDKKRRIEDFKPVALPKSDYGKFYSGDSSIVLQTTSPKGGAYLYDVHFWIGKDSSQMQIFVKTLTGKTITLEFIDSNSFTTPLQQQVKYKAKCEAMKRINKA